MNITLEEVKEALQYAQLSELLDEWELAHDKHSSEVIGLLLEELHNRNPEAFNAWLSQDKHDKSLREFMTA